MATFFIVDDEPILHELYHDILKMKGHEICGEAYSGSECIEKLFNSRPDPEYVIMDHRMPIKNGLEVMKYLLRVKPQLKIIFVSADSTIKKKAIDAGAIMFLKKPFNLNTFFLSLSKLKI
jgi:DNA-binding NtrC family response regulator